MNRVLMTWRNSSRASPHVGTGYMVALLGNIVACRSGMVLAFHVSY